MIPPTVEIMTSLRTHFLLFLYCFGAFGAPSSLGEGGRIGRKGPPDCTHRLGTTSIRRGRNAAHLEALNMPLRNILDNVTGGKRRV